MDRLPQEILDKIAEYIPVGFSWKKRSRYPQYMRHTTTSRRVLLHDPDPDRSEWEDLTPANLAGFATLSTSWQAAIEKITFAQLRVSSHDLPMFKQLYSQESRRRNLRHLLFDVVLPSYSDKACARHEEDWERKVNDDAATQAILELLQELSQWSIPPVVTLYLGAYSPKDPDRRSPKERLKDLRDTREGRRHDLYGERFQYSLLRICRDSHLPRVACVRAIELLCLPRQFHPDSQLFLLSCFPNSISGVLIWDELQKYPVWNDKIRMDLVPYLHAHELRDMKRLTFIIRNGVNTYAKRQPLSSMLLCDAVHKMTEESGATELVYHGPVHAHLFGPSVSDGGHPTWASVRILAVELSLENPAALPTTRRIPLRWGGAPKNDLPPGYGPPRSLLGIFENPENHIRDYLDEDDDKDALEGKKNADHDADDDDDGDDDDDEKGEESPKARKMRILVPIFEAFVKRLVQMPALKRAALWAVFPAQFCQTWSICYYAPFEISDGEELPDADTTKARVYVHNWQPPKHIFRLLSRIGHQNTGERAKVSIVMNRVKKTILKAAG